MKIAVVLHGQPRDYLKGHEHIMKFIQTQPECKFDFFYHCWSLEENQKYSHATWRNVDETSLIFTGKTISDLQTLYNPVSCEIENQNNVSFDKSLYENTIAFNNTNELKKRNINNILCQMYSRNKARNLLGDYLRQIGNMDHYDFVMTLRFDLGCMPVVNFNELDKSKIHISNLLCPRKIIPDICIISPTKTYLEWFDIYERLTDLLNNEELRQKCENLNEQLEINAEELIFAKYIFHNNGTDDIRFFKVDCCSNEDGQFNQNARIEYKWKPKKRFLMAFDIHSP